MEMFHFLFIILALLHTIAGDQISINGNDVEVKMNEDMDEIIDTKANEVKFQKTAIKEDDEIEKEKETSKERKIETFITPEPEVDSVNVKTSSSSSSSSSSSDFSTFPTSISSSLTWKDVMEAWGKGIYNAMEPLFVRKIDTNSHTDTDTIPNDESNDNDVWYTNVSDMSYKMSKSLKDIVSSVKKVVDLSPFNGANAELATEYMNNAFKKLHLNDFNSDKNSNDVDNNDNKNSNGDSREGIFDNNNNNNEKRSNDDWMIHYLPSVDDLGIPSTVSSLYGNVLCMILVSMISVYAFSGTVGVGPASVQWRGYLVAILSTITTIVICTAYLERREFLQRSRLVMRGSARVLSNYIDGKRRGAYIPYNSEAPSPQLKSTSPSGLDDPFESAHWLNTLVSSLWVIDSGSDSGSDSGISGHGWSSIPMSFDFDFMGNKGHEVDIDDYDDGNINANGYINDSLEEARKSEGKSEEDYAEDDADITIDDEGRWTNPRHKRRSRSHNSRRTNRKSASFSSSSSNTNKATNQKSRKKSNGGNILSHGRSTGIDPTTTLTGGGGLGAYVSRSLADSLRTELALIPRDMGGLELKEFSLGSTPPTIFGLRAGPTGPCTDINSSATSTKSKQSSNNDGNSIDNSYSSIQEDASTSGSHTTSTYNDEAVIKCSDLLWLDLDFIYFAGDMNIELQLRPPDLHITLPEGAVHVSSLYLSGSVRLAVESIPEYPFLGNASFSFLNVPNLDMSVSTFGGIDLASIPILHGWVNQTLFYVISQMTLPHTVDFDLASVLCPNCNEDDEMTQSKIARLVRNIKGGFHKTRTVLTESLERVAKATHMIPGLHD